MNCLNVISKLVFSIKYIYGVLFIFFTITTNCYAQTVEKVVADSACRCIEKLNVDTIVSTEQKKIAIKNCFLIATKKNEELIASNKSEEMKGDHLLGQTYGRELGQKINEILKNDCPKFKALISSQ